VSYETREWRIQCKRERSIGPSAIEGIADDLVGDVLPFGVIVAAACDFSKRTRDAFRARMAKARIEQFFLWGKAELEDALFRPENDHLLWAYFGISLRVRRASTAAIIRSRIATKRGLVRAIGDVGNLPRAQHVLLRDPEARDYPWPTDQTRFQEAPHWRYYRCEGLLAPDLLGFVTKDQYAWWDVESETYDIIPEVDISWPRHPELAGVTPPGHEHQDHAHRFWTIRTPESNQAHLIEISLLHYDQILAIDELGDAYHEGPHLFIDFEGRETPFRKSVLFVRKYGVGGPVEVRVEKLKKQAFFPTPLPDISEDEWRAHWDARLSK
jgi:hypothetical protein